MSSRPPDHLFKRVHSSVIPTAAARGPSDLPLLFLWWPGWEPGRCQTKAGCRDGNQDGASHLRSADSQETSACGCQAQRRSTSSIRVGVPPTSQRTGRKSELLRWDTARESTGDSPATCLHTLRGRHPCPRADSRDGVGGGLASENRPQPRAEILPLFIQLLHSVHPAAFQSLGRV